MYQDVEEGSADDGAVAAEPGVGDGGAEQRQQHGGAEPRVDGRRGGRRGLAERAGEVDHQVPHDAAEREALRDLHSCARHIRRKRKPYGMLFRHGRQRRVIFSLAHGTELRSTDDEERGGPPAGAAMGGRPAEVVHGGHRRLRPRQERLGGLRLHCALLRACLTATTSLI